MIQTKDKRPVIPPLAFRVGITGMRNLRADQLARVQSLLAETFALVKQQMAALANDKATAESYTHEPGAPPVCTFCVVSPLARGADRLAARAALDHGYQLFVPMPFSREEYEKDFSGHGNGQSEELAITAEQDLAEFRGLLERASAQLALDGKREGNSGHESLMERSYDVVGRFVVRHCDLLIAVWDGKPGQGRGGTADIVHFAAGAGVPVWWINAIEPAEPRWIADVEDLLDPHSTHVAAPLRLQNYLERLIPAPARMHHPRLNWIGRLATLCLEKPASQAAVYFKETALPNDPIWKTYSMMIGWMSGAVTAGQPEARRARQMDPAADYWLSMYEPADELACAYSDRYRSSYVLVIFFTTLALVFGASGLGFAVSSRSGSKVFHGFGIAMVGAELAMLILIVSVVAMSLRREWQERSIEYRLLAELFRKQQTLADLGWSLSVGSVERMTDSPRLSWLAWLFTAAQRAAPLPTGDFTTLEKKTCGREALDALILEQLVYHRKREQTAMQSGERFENLGSYAFFAVLLFVLTKLIAELFLDNESFVILLGLMVTVLPGISAAFVAIRSYAELELLAEQSRHMIKALERAKARAERLNLNRPLVSQDMGAQGLEVAKMMLQDLEGWGRLFSGKELEAS